MTNRHPAHDLILAALLLAACGPSTTARPESERPDRLPTGQRLDPAGLTRPVGQMPLGIALAPDGRHVALLLSGYREQGLQIVDRTGTVTQTIPQKAAFVGLAFAPDGKSLYASGGNLDLIYRYTWTGDSAILADSIILGPRDRHGDATHYPAGIALSPDGATMYVAEDLADSIAVVDLASGTVTQRIHLDRYPYGVAVTADGMVFASSWNADSVAAFRRGASGRLAFAGKIAAGRHASALALNPSGTRLFAASGSTDRVTVIDAKRLLPIAVLRDTVPSGVQEGATPNALALSADGTRLYAAEGDANAVAVFELSGATAGTTSPFTRDAFTARIPTAWYPVSLIATGDTLIVASGKGMGTAPDPQGPIPGVARVRTGPTADRQYTLSQLEGAVSVIPLNGAPFDALTRRVYAANGWDGTTPTHRFPPFRHVVYILRENRTYDQVLGDLPKADGDSSLVFFGRQVTPNAHALAERFGVFDRFFVNAEVSGDGHNWSMGAYATDYVQKSVPVNYSSTGGRSYDYEGTNRDSLPTDDVAAPAQGYLWDLAARSGISFQNFGERVADREEEGRKVYIGSGAFLSKHTAPEYPGFDLGIPDQHRADLFLAHFAEWVKADSMPALVTILLPRDHTAGGSAGSNTPRAMVADNDLALGRIVEGVSKSPFWKNTLIVVLEDDAQDGPDHVDSHRSPLFLISAWSRPGVYHRFTNTTDAIRTIEDVLGLGHLSQFDGFGRPITEVWRDTPDLRPYDAVPAQIDLGERNPAHTRAARESARLDLSDADRADEETFNHILWRMIKGDSVPYPGPTRMGVLEAMR
ncbi:MAG TPA: bifunctional YncE family protein/alkaline phosphatase family protein [Gemmatimonadales bacterium]|nr:bifunctional YncE family protein/alkaline phosphatase family protein [Gemmatimonadales bacterium]